MRRVWIWFLLVGIISANTLVVDSDPDSDNKNCEGDPNLYTKIGDAVDDADDGDEIEICKGDYNESVGVTKSLTFTGGKDVTAPSDVHWYNSDTPLIVNEIVDIDLSNLSLTSDDEYGIYMYKGRDVSLDNVWISAKKSAVYGWKNVNGDYSFKNSRFRSENQYGIYFQKGKSFDAQSITVSSYDRGIYLNSDFAGSFSMKDSLIHSESRGLDIKGGDDCKIELSRIDADTEAIYLDENVSGDYTFKNLYLISSSGSGVEILNGHDVTLQDSTIDAQEDGIHIAQEVDGDIKIDTIAVLSRTRNGVIIDGADDVDIQKSCIKKYGGDEGYAFDINTSNSDDDNPAKVQDNCLYGPSLSLLGRAKYKNTIDPNYWQGLSADSYRYNNIVDDDPSRQCPNDCSFVMPYDIVADYWMDACSWDGSAGGVVDSSGGGNDATAQNGVDTTSQGALCSGGSFDGEDDYIEIPKFDDDPFQNGITISVWVRFDRDKDGSWERIVDLMDGIGQYNIVLSRYENTNDLTFWVYDDSDNTDHAIYLTATDAIIPGELHHYTVTMDAAKNLKIYRDGELLESGSTEIDAAHDRDGKNYIGKSNVSDRDDAYFKGLIDELELFDAVLDDNEVNSLYENEKNLKNYDGSDRTCPSCGEESTPSYRFDAWDSDRGLDDRNISTKIVAEEFNVTVASLDENGSDYQEFNGTVCVKIGNEIQKSLFEEQNSSDLSFTIDRADADMQVEISWKENSDEACPLSDEDNATLSTDHFALRPDAFAITPPAAAPKAGSEWVLGLQALDANATATKDYNVTSVTIEGESVRIDYNETKENCRRGTLQKVDTEGFADGEADVTLVYDEVGALVLRVREVNGSEFAAVDRDDTPLSQRLIEEANATVSIVPHHFELQAAMADFDMQSGMTYLSQNMPMAAKVEMNITARNEANETTENFIESCYADDITIDFSHTDVVSDRLQKVLWSVQDANETNGSKQENEKNDPLRFIYPKKNFSAANALVDSNGTTVLQLFFNFDRNESRPVDPFRIEIEDINVTDAAAKSEGYETFEGNATFYYGRIRIDDVMTKASSITHRYRLQIYDTNGSDPLIAGMKGAGLYWWLNAKEGRADDGKVERYDVKTGFTLSAADDDHLSLKNFSDPVDGVVTFDLEYDTDVTQTVRDVVHLDISPWLWYVPEGLGGDYDYGSGSDCTRHPCFEYVLYAQGGAGVRSGEMNGSDFAVPAGEKQRSGIKLFR